MSSRGIRTVSCVWDSPLPPKDGDDGLEILGMLLTICSDLARQLQFDCRCMSFSEKAEDIFAMGRVL